MEPPTNGSNPMANLHRLTFILFIALCPTADVEPTERKKKTYLLDLSCRLLVAIPHSSLTHVTNARTLILSYNRLATLPSSWSLKSLVTVKLVSNKFTSVPMDFFKASGASVTCLDLSRNAIHTIPDDFVGALPKLKLLSMSHNQLVELPAALSKLSRLKALDFYCNKLLEVSGAIFKGLIALERLDLGDNKLEKLPDEIGSSCVHLTRLHVYGNKLTYLPDAMKALTSLKDVSFRWNKLAAFPAVLCSLPSITHLDLSGNPMTELTNLTIENWRKLERLSFYANKLTAFPASLLKLPKLKSLLLLRNPVELCQQEIDLLTTQNKKVYPPRFVETEFCGSTGDQIVDKIKGCIFGGAIGDAIGLAGEFMNAAQVQHSYGGSPINYDTITRFGFQIRAKPFASLYDSLIASIRDDHRYNFEAGDWTDDTDQLLLIMQSVLSQHGKIHQIDFAKRLKYWVSHGFDLFGDTKGNGCGQTIRSIANDPGFEQGPERVAQAAWENSGCSLASNGAVMRTAILGIFEYNDISAVISNTKKLCRVTHADPRAISSCIAVTVTIALTLSGKHDVTTSEGIEAIVAAAEKHALKELPHEMHSEFLMYLRPASIAQLQLDDPSTIGYTFKAMGSAFYAFRQLNQGFRTIIEDLTLAGGDADTNCVVAGAVLGCRLSISALPSAWFDGLIHRDWLENQIHRLLVHMKIPFAHLNTRRKSDRAFYTCGTNYQTLGRLSNAVWTETANVQVGVVQGDLTQFEVDAVVTTVDEDLSHPVGTLERQIHEAAGPDLLEDISSYGRCKVGKAILTLGYKLPALCVVHTVPPKAAKDIQKLSKCVGNILDLVSGAKLKTVAIPGLGIGAAGLDVGNAARIIVEAVRSWLVKNPATSIEKILLVLFTQVNYNAFVSEIRK